MTGSVSDTQRSVIEAGSRREKSWQRFTPVDLPPVPDWARDAQINWMDKWGNFPELKLRLNYDPLDKAGVRASNREELEPRWNRFEHGVSTFYLGEAEGMAAVHYHDGGVSRDADGNLQTSRQDGYGGAGFNIRMASDSSFYPGEIITLRGPWHSGAPAGYVEVYCHVDNWKRDETRRKWARKLPHLGPDRERWWNLDFTFGWYVDRPTLLAIFAKYRPEIEWAIADHGSWRRLEPIDPHTNCPKGFTPEQEVK